jgi:hypothetical protein
MIMLLAIGFGSLAALVVKVAYWDPVHSSDLGTMSQSWIAEYNASHPNP